MPVGKEGLGCGGMTAGRRSAGMAMPPGTPWEGRCRRPARTSRRAMRAGADEEVFGVRRDLDDVGHPQVPRPVKPWPDRWDHCPKLLSVHLRHQPTQARRDGRREPVDSVPCRCLLTVRIPSTAVSACLPAHRI